MQYRDTAIFSDLDGTLFNSDSVISRENVEAIRAYTEAGGLFAIATGRGFSNSMYYMKTVVPNAPSVVYNGSGVYDPRTGTYPYRVFADHDAMLKILFWCRDNLPQTEITAYGEHATYWVTPRETATPMLVEQLMPCEFVPLETVRDLPLFKTLHYGVPEETEALQRFLDESGLGARVAVVRAITGIPPFYEHIELLPKDLNKGTALDACRSLPCYAGRTLFGVGDYTNDLELLRHADVACCPANASDDVKAVADHILVSNDDHAIAKLIRDLIPSL